MANYITHSSTSPDCSSGIGVVLPNENVCGACIDEESCCVGCTVVPKVKSGDDCVACAVANVCADWGGCPNIDVRWVVDPNIDPDAGDPNLEAEPMGDDTCLDGVTGSKVPGRREVTRVDLEAGSSAGGQLKIGAKAFALLAPEISGFPGPYKMNSTSPASSRL